MWRLHIVNALSECNLHGKAQARMAFLEKPSRTHYTVWSPATIRDTGRPTSAIIKPCRRYWIGLQMSHSRLDNEDLQGVYTGLCCNQCVFTSLCSGSSAPSNHIYRQSIPGTSPETSSSKPKVHGASDLTDDDEREAIALSVHQKSALRVIDRYPIVAEVSETEKNDWHIIGGLTRASLGRKIYGWCTLSIYFSPLSNLKTDVNNGDMSPARQGSMQSAY
jgi:hypothetical protein